MPRCFRHGLRSWITGGVRDSGSKLLCKSMLGNFERMKRLSMMSLPRGQSCCMADTFSIASKLQTIIGTYATAVANLGLTVCAVISELL